MLGRRDIPRVRLLQSLLPIVTATTATGESESSKYRGFSRKEKDPRVAGKILFTDYSLHAALFISRNEKRKEERNDGAKAREKDT